MTAIIISTLGAVESHLSKALGRNKTLWKDAFYSFKLQIHMCQNLTN